MRGLLLLLVICSSLLSFASTSDCKHAQNCSACIQTPNCIWCGKSGEFGTSEQSLVRCVDRTSLLDEWSFICGEENIYKPDNLYQVLRDDELAQAGVLAGSGSAAAGGAAWGSSSSSSSRHESLVQMRPQNIALKLRVRESQSLRVMFRQAEDYPVDLYYLMDLSKSMEDDKDSLSALGATLAEEMQKITRNFRLGFGSFVDKVVMPYVSTVPEKLVAPCKDCARPYGFRNALRLNDNASLFVDHVRTAPVSGNLDAPEGGFDAIMQAIKCKNQIGWRDNARHLLLFSTDAGFHYAGDGKLGGIVKPNDGECHLDNEGVMYTHSTLLDYPSVSQINQVAKEDNINIIFAVTSEQTSVYTRLAQMIEGSSTGQLTANSSNIVDLVKTEYSKITSKVELKDNATAPVHIRYFSSCKGGPEVETSVCDNLHVGDQVEFRAEVTLDSCPRDPSLWRQLVRISPVALADELLLDLEMFCDCACERPGHEGFSPQSPECDGHGTYQCGVCSCDPGYLGRRCECGSDTPLGSGEVDDSSCRVDNNSKICSGQGSCNCGECICNERDNDDEVISGKYCDCTNFLCDRHDGELCSGPSHGQCVCDKCVCRPGWTGDACQCMNSTQSCINPDSGILCSGDGKCECNQCKCDETKGGRYSGKWCEDCPLCGQEFNCANFKDCVECRVFESGPLMEEPGFCDRCSLLYSEYTHKLVTNYTINVTDWVEAEEGEQSCTFFDENDCRFTFVYGYDEKREPVVRVQQTLECPPKLDILGIVLGVIGAIVAVGLALLLMWKVLTTIHDRREYAQFEKERMMAKWDTGENPIYKQATSTFKNPLYGGK